MGRRRGVPLPMKYKVKITIFDKNGVFLSRNEKPFRLRMDAEDYAKRIKKDHYRSNIISYIEVVKLEGNEVVQTYKTKRSRR